MILEALRKNGLLLMQDKKIANAVAIIAGAPVSGSWWSHPRGKEMFRRLRALEDDEDVLVSRLVGGKVTYVHRPLWRSFLAVATSGDPWQKRGLPKTPTKKDIQERLLAAAEEVHTESGRHEIRFQPWPEWAKSRGVKIVRVTKGAYEELEEKAIAIGATAKMLPWNRF